MSKHRTKQFLGEEARVKQMLIKKIWLTRSIRRSRSWRRKRRGKMRALKSMRRRRLSL